MIDKIEGFSKVNTMSFPTIVQYQRPIQGFH